MKKQLLVISCILFLHISCTKRYCYICNTDKTIISPLGRVTQSNEPSKLICDKTEDEKKVMKNHTHLNVLWKMVLVLNLEQDAPEINIIMNVV
ncbi:MAG TPA: hypothetical protein PKD00_05020 [Burkholderiales bacterium]|nr:hypothetical protein [Burkholderiales bacterium]